MEHEKSTSLRSKLAKVTRFVGELTDRLSTPLRLVALVYAFGLLLMTIPDAIRNFHDEVVRLGLSSSMGIGDQVILVVTPEPDREATPLLTASTWLHNHSHRRHWYIDNVCLTARPGFARSGDLRIRLASVPERYWDALRAVRVQRAETMGGDCSHDAQPPSEEDLFLVQRFSQGDSFVLIGALSREGDHWRTRAGWGVSTADIDDLRRGASAAVDRWIRDVLSCIVSCVLIALMLFSGSKTRLWRRDLLRGASTPSPT